jgi:hypothetical protein
VLRGQKLHVFEQQHENDPDVAAATARAVTSSNLRREAVSWPQPNLRAVPVGDVTSARLSGRAGTKCE